MKHITLTKVEARILLCLMNGHAINLLEQQTKRQQQITTALWERLAKLAK